MEHPVVEEGVKRQGGDKTDDQKCVMEGSKAAAEDEELNRDDIERHQGEEKRWRLQQSGRLDSQEGQIQGDQRYELHN